MDAKTFLQGIKTGATTAESHSAGNKQGGESSPVAELGSFPTAAPETLSSGASEPVSEQDTPLVFSDTTPSGIVVEYEPQPRRLYRVNGVEVPSVTTVLDVLSKDGLKFWGQDVGVRAILELFSRGRLATVIDWKDDSQAPVIVNGLEHEAATFDSLKKLITAEKLSCNHVLNKAADRGTNVHDALEQWAKSGGEFYPSPTSFPEEERPYVEGLLEWVDTMAGVGVPVLCETMVGSERYGFAGRYDLTLELREPVEFVTRHYKRKDHKTLVVAPGRLLIDAKTTKATYRTHHLQLAAYELAAVECGYDATAAQFILRLDQEGFYEFVPSLGTSAQFLAVKRAHDALSELGVR